MTESSAGPSLADQFPPPTLEQWRGAVGTVRGRGGKDLTPEQRAERFERDLVTPTVAGLVIQPLYTDLGDAPEPGVPGAAPVTGGATRLAQRS